MSILVAKAILAFIAAFATILGVRRLASSKTGKRPADRA